MRKHKFIDKHPILGSILFGMLLLVLRELITTVLATAHILITRSDPSPLMSIVYMLIGTFAMFLFYKLWFSPEFTGVLIDGNVKEGLLLGWPFLIYWIITAIAMVIDHTFALKGFNMEVIKVSLTAGFVEELIFRHGMVSTMLRNRNQPDQLVKVCLIGSVVFGLVHAMNIFAGASLLPTILQVFTAGCLGVVFGSLLISSGSLWPSIILHAVHDIYAISTTNEVSDSGVVTGGISFSSIVDLICCIAFAAYAIYRILPAEKREKIVRIWNHKWGKEEFKPVDQEQA